MVSVVGRSRNGFARLMLFITVALAIAALGFMRGAAAVGVGDYFVSQLGGPTGTNPYVRPYDVNNAGTSVGDFYDPATEESLPGRKTRAGGVENLALLPTPTALAVVSGTAYAVNEPGQVVGFVKLVGGGNDTRAFSWTAASGLIDLGSPFGLPSVVANDVNDAGQIVGYAEPTDDSSARAFLWTSGGGFQPITNTLGGSNSAATAINEAGQVVGWADDAAGDRRAFRWTATGGMVALSPLYSEAGGINELGQVIGYTYSDADGVRYRLWDTAGAVMDLGQQPAGFSIDALTAINDLGQVLGYGYNAGVDASHTFIWFPGVATPNDLGSLGTRIGQGRGLNDRGEIAAYVQDRDTPGRLARGELLTPNDTTAPVTTATPIGTPGNGGVFRSDVTVNLTTNDSGDPTPFGVARITYSASGAQTIPATNASGANATVPITAEGATTLTFYATDNAGNVETPKVLTVQIDETAPILTTTVNPTSVQPGQSVTITVATSEPLAGPPTVTVAGTCIVTATVTMTAGATPGTYTGTYTLPGDAGVCTVTVTASGTDNAGNPSTGGIATFASLGAPPVVTLDRTALNFGNQRVGTTSSPQRIVLTNVGGRPLAIGEATFGGAHPTDFVIAYTSCAGNLVPQQSCVIGVSFAPTTLGERSATLILNDNAVGSPRTIMLSGNGAVGNFTVTASASGGGSVTPSGTTAYPGGGLAKFTASAAAGQIFLGWTLDEQYVGYANPIDFTVNGDRTLIARFAPRPAFGDVPPGDPDYEAYTRLAALGIVNPVGADGQGNTLPGRSVSRAEVAAFVARTFGWQKEFHRNTFPDRCQPDGTVCIDDELWNNVAALADYGVVGGYTDAATCQSAGTTAPCYLPRDTVNRVQVVSIVARAFTKTPDLRATGYWDRLPGVPGQYTNVGGDGVRSDLATYRANAGPVPGQADDGTFPDPNGAAMRRFVIQVLFQAYQSQFSVDRVP